GELDDSFELDFPIKFAHDFVAHVQPGKRTEEVRQARQFIGDTRRVELDKVAEELKGIGVDWSDPPADVPTSPTPVAPPGVEVKVETDRPNNEVTAGESMNLKLTVTNKGPSTLYRVFAITKSENPMLDNKELILGKLEPGKSRTASVPAGWCD